MFYKIIIGILRPILKLLFKVRVHGDIDLGEDRLIICSNHIGILDPIVLACITDRPISFMGKKELFDIPVLKNIIRGLNAFPVDRDKPSMSTIKEAINLLKDEKILGIFIEGTRVKEFSIDNAKAGVGMMAYRANSDIQPFKIESNYKLFSEINVYVRDRIDINTYDKESHSYQEIAEDILLTIYDKKESIKNDN